MIKGVLIFGSECWRKTSWARSLSYNSSKDIGLSRAPMAAEISLNSDPRLLRIFMASSSLVNGDPLDARSLATDLISFMYSATVRDSFRRLERMSRRPKILDCDLFANVVWSISQACLTVDAWAIIGAMECSTDAMIALRTKLSWRSQSLKLGLINCLPFSV